jgi:peptidoglycan hydrolase-like protein with peptidoglycan-binding domain
MKASGQFQKKSAAAPTAIPLATDLFRSRPFPKPSTTTDEDAVATKPDLQARLDFARRSAPNLQRLAANSSRDRAALAVQPKLTVGAPNDQYEQEADRVADQVMSTPDAATQAPIQREAADEEELQTKPLAAAITPLVQREMAPEEEEVQAKRAPDLQREEMPEEEELQTKPIASIQREAMPEEEEVQTKPLGGSIQREAMPEEEELQAKPLGNGTLQREAMPEAEEAVQMKGSPDAALPAGSKLESRLSNSQDGGSPLPEAVRTFMEPRFGADFSQVRVHTGSEAVQMNRDLNAQAFTHKQDVYFGAEKAPGKDALTAHELTHVVQQTGSIQTKGNVVEGLIQRAPGKQPPAYTVQSGSIAASPRLVKAANSSDSSLKLRQFDPPKTTDPAIRIFKDLLTDNLGTTYDKLPDVTKDGDVSGTYGSQTAAAVKLLQQTMDVPNSDGGSAGRQTIRALDELIVSGGIQGLTSLDTSGNLPGSGAAPLAVSDLIHRQIISNGALATADLIIASWSNEPAYWLYLVFNALRQNHRSDYNIVITQPNFQLASRLSFINRVIIWPDLLLDSTQIPAGLLTDDDLGQLTGMALSGMVYAPKGTPRAAWDDPRIGIPKKGGGPPGSYAPWMIYSIEQVRSQTRRNRGMDQRGSGWIYSAASNGGQFPTEVAASPEGSIERAIWNELGSEGSAASINTYDGGMVTWGTGFAATGELPALIDRMSPAILTELYRAGVAVGDKGRDAESSFRYVDTSAKVVLTGHDATSALRNDPATLSIMISAGEGHLQEMLDATWAQIKARKLDPLDKPELKVVRTWPEHLIKFCVHAMHFASSLTWEKFVALGGNDGSNVRAIIAATLAMAKYRFTQNGAHIAKPDSAGTAAVPYDFGKQRGASPTDPFGRKWKTEGALLHSYVSDVELFPADAETNSIYRGTWFLPVDYGETIPFQPGQNCRRFVDH